MRSHEKPLYVAEYQLSPNPVHWVGEILKTTVWGLLPAIGWVAGVLWFAGPAHQAAMAKLGAPYLGGLLAAFVAFALWRWWRLDRTRIRFFADHLEVESRSRRSSSFTIELSYRDVRHVELTEDARILLVRGLPGEVEPYLVAVEMSKHTVGDAFDFMVDHMERAYPDHLFSVRESAAQEKGKLQYSRPWVWDGLFAGQPDVNVAEFAPPVARAGDTSYAVAYDRGYRVSSRDASPSATLFVASRAGVRHGNGMVLVPEVSHVGDTFEIAFDEDLVVSVDLRGGSVRVDEQVIGHVEDSGGRLRVEGVTQPALLWIALLAVFADFKMAETLRGFRGEG